MRLQQRIEAKLQEFENEIIKKSLKKSRPEQMSAVKKGPGSPAQVARVETKPQLGQPSQVPPGGFKVQLKLEMPHGIRKVMDQPRTADNLRKLIQSKLQNSGCQQNFKVEYEDAEGD